MYESLPDRYHDTELWTPDLRPPPSTPMPFLRRRWVQAAGAGVLGLVIGLLAGGDKSEGLGASSASLDQRERAVSRAEEQVEDGLVQIRRETERLAVLREELERREAEVARRE